MSRRTFDRGGRAREHARVTLDWGAGEYERTARELEPAAHHVVALAGIARGERVLDLACGTGNAAIEAGPPGAPGTRLGAARRPVRGGPARAPGARGGGGVAGGGAPGPPLGD